MGRRNLLFVTDVFPFPLDRGQHLRVHNLLAACSGAFDVTFVGPRPGRDEHREQVESRCTRALYLDRPEGGFRERLAVAAGAAAAAPGLPTRGTLRMYRPFVSALRSLDLAAFDAIWAERVHVARVVRSLAARTILDLDDIEHVKIRRRLALGRDRLPLQEWYRYALYRRAELRWARRFLAAVVCSDDDRRYLAGHGCSNAVTVPNGVDVPPPAQAEQRSRPGTRRIVFLGNVAYEPNLDAIAFFVDEILPRLRARLPGLTFDVIGPGATPEVVERYRPHVTFRGFVPDLARALREYDALVAPIRFGGGTKLKVLDAMAAGVPVVTTPVGAEGLSLGHREHAWIAKSAQDLAEGAQAVLCDGTLAESMAARAYRLVRERFSWDAIRADMTEWLSRLQVPR